MSGGRFQTREFLDGDRESWEVWDSETCEIAEPLEDNCDLSQGEAEQRAARLNDAQVTLLRWWVG